MAHSPVLARTSGHDPGIGQTREDARYELLGARQENAGERSLWPATLVARFAVACLGDCQRPSPHAS
jgi:hypothetical protein